MHTSIPWEVRTHNYATFRDAQGIFAVGSNNPIIDGVWGRNLTESDDNAALIVRAVNNHEALVAALEAARIALIAHGCGIPESIGNQAFAQVDTALTNATKE